MDINKFAEMAHDNAVRKGWWSANDRITDKLLMIHSEVSEAVDNYRHDLDMTEELADVLIRTMDLMFAFNIDIESALLAKHEKNTKRGYRHGNLKI